MLELISSNGFWVTASLYPSTPHLKSALWPWWELGTQQNACSLLTTHGSAWIPHTSPLLRPQTPSPWQQKENCQTGQAGWPGKALCPSRSLENCCASTHAMQWPWLIWHSQQVLSSPPLPSLSRACCLTALLPPIQGVIRNAPLPWAEATWEELTFTSQTPMVHKS